MFASCWPTIADPVQDTEIARLAASLRSEDVVDLGLLEIATLERLDGIRKIAERRCRRDFHGRALLAEHVSAGSLEELRAALCEEYKSGVRFQDDLEIDCIACH